jgi:hypothetical protein
MNFSPSFPHVGWPWRATDTDRRPCDVALHCSPCCLVLEVWLDLFGGQI